MDEYGYFGDLVSSVDDPHFSATDHTMSVFPNPARQTINISFELEQPLEIRFRLVDFTGRTLIASSPGGISSGTNNIQFTIESLTPGLYALILETGSDILGRRVFVKE